MKFLIITQSVDRNNPILGFFHRWVEEFSKHFESVVVICLEKGDYDLPSNIKVLSLGKEKSKIENWYLKIFQKIKYTLTFWKYIWNERKNYDAVFVHMNPIYVILGGLFWRIFNKKIGLWYVHKTVDFKLRVAIFLSNYILTASKESFRYDSKKRHIVGHGIDVHIFKPLPHNFSKKIITTGRITETKNILRMIDIFKSLLLTDDNYTFTIIGNAVTTKDLEYKKLIMDKIDEFNLSKKIFFLGSKSQIELSNILPLYDVYLNLSDTGSVDKAVLEAASCGLEIITTNEAFKDILGGSYSDNDLEILVSRIRGISNFNNSNRALIIKQFDLGALVERIKKVYEKDSVDDIVL